MIIIYFINYSNNNNIKSYSIYSITLYPPSSDFVKNNK